MKLKEEALFILTTFVIVTVVLFTMIQIIRALIRAGLDLL